MAKDSAERSALLMNRSLAEEIPPGAVKVPASRRFFSQSSEPKSTRRMKSRLLAFWTRTAPLPCDCLAQSHREVLAIRELAVKAVVEGNSGVVVYTQMGRSVAALARCRTAASYSSALVANYNRNLV